MHTYTGQEESHFHKDSTTRATVINPKPRSIGKRTTPTTKHYHLINLTSYIAYVIIPAGITKPYINYFSTYKYLQNITDIQTVVGYD